MIIIIILIEIASIKLKCLILDLRKGFNEE